MAKFGFVTIVGRPSAGKSTLLNRLCGHKVAIVSPLPQTTRNRIRGILSEQRGQLVFVDTPGFNLSQRTLNTRLRTLVAAALNSGDQVLYIVDTTRPPGAEEQALTDLLRAGDQPLTIALNKIDLKGAYREEHYLRLADALPKGQQVPLSAHTGEGLDTLKHILFDAAAEGIPHYPADIYTDQTPTFRIAEIIREQAIQRSYQELPHALYVEIIEVEQRAPDRLWVRAAIHVESESQKAIVIGAGGVRVRAIRRASQRALAHIFSGSIYIDLRVKTRPNWRRSGDLIKRMID